MKERGERSSKFHRTLVLFSPSTNHHANTGVGMQRPLLAVLF